VTASFSMPPAGDVPCTTSGLFSVASSLSGPPCSRIPTTGRMRQGDVRAWIREDFTPPHSFGNTLPWHPFPISSSPHSAEPAGTAEKGLRRERFSNPNTPGENPLRSSVSLQKEHLPGESHDLFRKTEVCSRHSSSSSLFRVPTAENGDQRCVSMNHVLCGGMNCRLMSGNSHLREDRVRNRM
jgi:hypothetical protein